jgi:hypothetical protein
MIDVMGQFDRDAQIAGKTFLDVSVREFQANKNI